jgi:hypothetical protein
MSSQAWMVWPENFAVSFLVMALLAMAFMYAARAPMHGLLRSVGHALSGPLRMAARWLLAAAAEVQARNRAVLLAHGKHEVGQRVEREFERLGVIVQRELQGYPALQRKLLDEITRIEEDYKKCGEVPPPPPEWTEAVAAVANVKTGGNELVLRVLEEIKRSITSIHDKTLADYRRSYERRHKILESFMPFWRSVDKNLVQVEQNMARLQANVRTVDAHMAIYEQINEGTDKAQHALTVSGFTQFATSLLVMCVAAGGAFINFKLIALPMSEMVGAGDYITHSLRTSEVAALVIIFVEASMGLFLLEALRITHLFPRIANLNDRLRTRMLWIALTLLVILAGVEAALALMRDMLISDKQAPAAVALHRAAGGARRLDVEHPDRGPDAARLHPALRARVHRHSARVGDPLRPHRGRGVRAGAAALARVPDAGAGQRGAADEPRADQALRRLHRGAAHGRAHVEGLAL